MSAVPFAQVREQSTTMRRNATRAQNGEEETLTCARSRKTSEAPEARCTAEPKEKQCRHPQTPTHNNVAQQIRHGGYARRKGLHRSVGNQSNSGLCAESRTSGNINCGKTRCSHRRRCGRPLLRLELCVDARAHARAHAQRAQTYRGFHNPGTKQFRHQTAT